MRRTTPRVPVLDTVETFLQNADLVKFARLTPSAEECELALSRAETVVRATLPEATSYEKAPPPEQSESEIAPEPPQPGGAT